MLGINSRSSKASHDPICPVTLPVPLGQFTLVIRLDHVTRNALVGQNNDLELGNHHPSPAPASLPPRSGAFDTHYI